MTAESLKPYYRQFCKRPCFHDEYLPTFNQPNVHLVDTDGKVCLVGDVTVLLFDRVVVVLQVLLLHDHVIAVLQVPGYCLV